MEFLTWYVLPLYLFTLAAVVGTTVFKRRRVEQILFYALTGLWSLIALLRPWGVTPDDSNYDIHLGIVCAFSNCGFDEQMGYSPLYYLAISILKDFADDPSVFLVLAAGFFFLKMVLIGRLTRHSLPALFMYVSIFFMLHDVVQFRVGVATFFLLLAISFASQSRYVKSALSYGVSLFIHAQAAVTPLFLVLERIFRRRYRLALGVAALTQVLAQFRLVPTQRVLALLMIEPGSKFTQALIDEPAGLAGTSLAMLLILAIAIRPLRRHDNHRLFVYAFYSVIAGFVLYWVGGMFQGISSRLAQFMWVPLVLLAPLARRSGTFFWGMLVLCCAYFYLQGWVNQLMSFQ